MILTKSLKQLRAAPGVNWAATTATRAIARGFPDVTQFAVKHLPKVGIVRSTLPNGEQLVLWSRGDDWISNQVYWRGWDGYEPETTRMFWTWAQHARVVLDIGAHVGYFSLLAAHANPRCQVFAFEPMAANVARLHGHIRLNGRSNIHPIESAVGDHHGTSAFYCGADVGAPLSSSAAYEYVQRQPQVRSFQSPITTVDRFVADHSLTAVDLVKIDTETTESHVLDGMRETIARFRPRIIVEVLGSGMPERIDAIARRHHYKSYLLTAAGPDLRDRIEADLHARNYVLADSLS